MPDQNNPMDPSSTPAQVNAPSEPTQMPEPPTDVPSMDAPPFPPEPSPIEGAAPTDTTSGSAAPSFDIPPVVTPAGKPKGGGRKVIATILGLLVLVGGLGAGVILVRQQQDIRERAALPGPTKTPTKAPEPTKQPVPTKTPEPTKVPEPTKQPVPTKTPEPTKPPNTCQSDAECQQGWFCNKGFCEPYKSPAPSPIGGTCTVPTTSSALGKACTNVSGTFNGNCVIIYCPNGLGSDGKCNLNDTGAWQKYGSCSSLWNSLGSNQCGQIDTVNENGVYCVPQGVCESKIVNNPTCSGTPTGPGPGGPTPTPSATPVISAQCLDIKAYDTSWSRLTVTQLSQLKAGDRVRFTVAGTSSGGGSIDKARFRINGVQRPEVTQKKAGTEEYYDEYVIPSGVTTFTIHAQIHHTTLGWSN